MILVMCAFRNVFKVTTFWADIRPSEMEEGFSERGSFLKEGPAHARFKVCKMMLVLID